MAAQMRAAQRGFITEKLHPTLGLEVRGLDASKPMDAPTTAALVELLNEHKVLLLRNQSLSSIQQTDFAAHFGDTNQVPPSFGGAPREGAVLRLGARDDVEADSNSRGYQTTAEFWHSDSSWRPVPTWLTFLYCVERPEVGGNTCFADMVAAYDALPAERKSFLEGRRMTHSWATMRRYEPSIPPLGDDAPPPVTHPIVRTVGGRKCLFVSGLQSYRVEGMPPAEGEALHLELMEHATSPAFVHQHKWSAKDLIIWNNRLTLHRVMPYDRSQRRVMYRAEVIDVESPR